MNVKTFAIIGGDFRNLSLEMILEKEGFKVNTFALSDRDSATFDLAIKKAQVVIGPIPFTNDGKTLNTPLYREQIYINDFLKSIDEKSLFIAGKLEKDIDSLCRQYLINTVDILKREDFSILNAIPTAEGALQIAMKETPFTLNSSNILITGFGRVGKVIAHMLIGFGANVYIVSNSYDEQAFASAYGIQYIDFKELKNHIGKMNIVFNTVPALVLDSEILELASRECLIIDIASKPGGVDFEKSKMLGIKTIWALSLPGKVAPQTSAKIIRDIVFNIIHEKEV